MQQEIAQLIVSSLNLDIAPGDIDPSAPLFGSGLGLDSIDALELVCAIKQKYGFQIDSEQANRNAIFENLASLSQHVSHQLSQHAS